MNLSRLAAIVAECRFEGWQFLVASDGERAYLQVQAEGACSVTGRTMTWRGRKWWLSQHMTKSEIVQTAFKAVMTAVEHETRESFRYRGQPIFGPHFDVDRLAELCTDQTAHSVREEQQP